MARKDFTEQEMDRFVRLIERRRAVLKHKADDFYKRAGITERTFLKAKAENSMTEATYAKLLSAMELTDASEEIRVGVFQDNSNAIPSTKKPLTWPILISALIVVFLGVGSVCSLSDACRPSVEDSFYEEYTRYSLETDYFAQVTHNGSYTTESFIGPALIVPERPTIYFESGRQLAGPVDVSIRIYDRTSGAALQRFELEGHFEEYREPYFDNREVLRSVSVEIVECIAFKDDLLDEWVKQFRVFHPDAVRLNEQIMQEKYGDLKMIKVFEAQDEISDGSLGCLSNPIEEHAYESFLKSGNGEPLVIFDPDSLQPRRLEDIGLSLLGSQEHCIKLQFENFDEYQKYDSSYEILFRDSEGEVVPRHAICFKGQDRFTVEFVARDDVMEPLHPFSVEGLFDEAVQRDLNMHINLVGGRESIVSCSADFCGLRGVALDCYTIPPTITLSTQRREIFSVVLPNCADDKPVPHFQCNADKISQNELDGMNNWEVMLRYATGRVVFLEAVPAGYREFETDHRIDFPC